MKLAVLSLLMLMIGQAMAADFQNASIKHFISSVAGVYLDDPRDIFRGHNVRNCSLLIEDYSDESPRVTMMLLIPEIYAAHSVNFDFRGPSAWDNHRGLSNLIIKDVTNISVSENALQYTLNYIFIMSSKKSFSVDVKIARNKEGFLSNVSVKKYQTDHLGRKSVIAKRECDYTGSNLE